MISYAQNFEDVMLARAFQHKKQGFYIDVGAMDPCDGSVTKYFYDLGWKGVNIEPEGRFHERLVAERPRDVNLRAAIGEAEEVRTMYMFETQGVSTLSEEFRRYFATRGHPYREALVEVITLRGVCEAHCHEPIDFLKIDAEGWEPLILRGADWKKFRPTIAVIESREPYSHVGTWQEWEPEVLRAGYTFVYDDGINRFYLKNEKLEMQRFFEYPPNVLDDFVPFAVVKAQRERDRAKAEAARLSELLNQAWVKSNDS